MITLTPRTVFSYGDGALISWGSIEKENGFAEGFTNLPSIGAHIHGTTPMEFVLWNGHQFETVIGRLSYIEDDGLRLAWKENERDNFYRPHEYIATMYFPIDRRMQRSDIERATVAYANETNTGWLFAHCDSDYHIDHEYRLLAAVTTAFEAEMQRAEKVWRQSVYDCFLVNDRGNQAAVSGYQRMAHNLGLFREDVKSELLKTVRSNHLGHYHQNPHDAHVHAPLEQAIRTVIPIWEAKTTKILDWTPISTYVNGVLAKVAEKHTYETRWDKVARIAAEAEAESESQNDEI